MLALDVDRGEVQRVVREVARARVAVNDGEAAAHLFDRILSADSRVIDRFEADQRRYLVTIENSPAIVRSVALAPRERQLLKLVATGRPVKCIAFDLGLTPSTAAGYLFDGCRKTGLRSRSELVQWFSRCAA